MELPMLIIYSITHAFQGRDSLRQMGIRAYVKRTPRTIDPSGCSYSIEVYPEDIDRAEQILRGAKIRVTGRHMGESDT